MLDISMATPLSSALGVVIPNFDVHADLSDTDGEKLRSMLARHHLILFPDLSLSSAENRRLLEIFGPVKDEFHDGSYSSLVQNRISPDSDEGEEVIYHCDYSFLPDPVQVVSLYGMHIPGVCATTRFANGVRACRTLPADLRARLGDKWVLHASDVTESHPISSGRLTAADLEKKEFRGTLHPAILTHPRTGDEVLFINEYLSVRVEGLSRVESELLLSAAFAHLYAPNNVYEHHWRQGDLIVFDNIALTHKREKGAPRTLRRMIA